MGMPLNEVLDTIEEASLMTMRGSEPVSAEFERGFHSAFAIMKNYFNTEGEDAHV